jgi:Flp pilus assembly protein TadG
MKNFRTKRRKGATVVEFSIVAPVMLLMIFASLEIIRLGMMQGLAEDAAYQAARHVMVAGAKKQEGIDEANRLLALLGTRGATVEVHAFDKTEEQAEITDKTRRVVVDITIPISRNSLLAPMYTGDRQITTTSSLTFESYDGYYDGTSG